MTFKTPFGTRRTFGRHQGRGMGPMTRNTSKSANFVMDHRFTSAPRLVSRPVARVKNRLKLIRVDGEKSALAQPSVPFLHRRELHLQESRHICRRPPRGNSCAGLSEAGTGLPQKPRPT